MTVAIRLHHGAEPAATAKLGGEAAQLRSTVPGRPVARAPGGLFERRRRSSPPRGGHAVDDVGGDDRLGRARARGRRSAPRSSGGVDGRAGGRERLEPAREQRRDDPGEDVAGAGRGERRGAAAADRRRLAAGDDRVVALQQDDSRAGALGGLADARQPVGGDLRRTGRPRSRPSSPACGVSTAGVGGGRRATRAARRGR